MGVEEKTVKEGLGERVVEKSRANWCISPTYEGVEPLMPQAIAISCE